MFTHLGTTDSVTTCDCCGRTNLKHTVAIEGDEAGIVYYGTTCAAKALKIPIREIKKAATAADAAYREVVAAARRKHDTKASGMWREHLTAKLGRTITDFTGDISVCLMIDAIGGWSDARRGFARPVFMPPPHPATRLELQRLQAQALRGHDAVV